MLCHVSRIDIHCFSCDHWTTSIVALKYIPHRGINSPIMNIYSKSFFQLKWLVIHLHEKVLLVSYWSWWQNSNVEVDAPIHKLSPTFVIKYLIQCNLVLNETFPTVEPFVAYQVPDLVICDALLVCMNHQA